MGFLAPKGQDDKAVQLQTCTVLREERREDLRKASTSSDKINKY